MKKWLALVLAVTMAFCLTSCAKKEAPVPAATEAPVATEAPATEAPKTLKVTMITDLGGINDKSFNESAWAGLQRAQDELGIEVKYIESKTESDYGPNIETAVDDGSDLVLCVGFLMADCVKEAAESYPDQMFAIIDNDSLGDNVVGVQFAVEECSYLVGVAAAKMTKTNNVGFVIGMSSPSMDPFGYGYVAGVKDTNPDITVQDNNVNSFGDAAAGKAAAINMITNGADVVYHAAGGSGMGVIEAAKEQGKYAIGVDQDQSALAPENVITSAMKRVDNGVYNVCKALVNGTLAGGTVLYDLTTGCVDIAPTTDLLSEEALAAIDAAKAGILDGSIVIPTTAEEFNAKYGDIVKFDDK